MCYLCPNLNFDAHQREQLIAEEAARPCSREELAALLSILDGECPAGLVRNTLDEEPADGMVAPGIAGHFAWRDRLFRADARLATDAARRLVNAGGRGNPGPPARRPVLRIVRVQRADAPLPKAPVAAITAGRPRACEDLSS